MEKDLKSLARRGKFGHAYVIRRKVVPYGLMDRRDTLKIQSSDERRQVIVKRTYMERLGEPDLCSEDVGLNPGDSSSLK
ncbi:hypothetical protein Btru_001759 [Bulinus truncatus]|nr:hypothetical protein Btru_001759 [Bulinus truncatus]